MARLEISPSCQIPNLATILEAVFPSLPSGTFVEVGAHDGVSYSNTWGLARAGWRGVYVEPVAELLGRCRAEHAGERCSFHALAVGAREGEIELELGDVFSTASPAMAEILRGVEWARGAMSGERRRVPVVTLDRLLEREGIAPGFELLVIDVEGYEPQVLAGFDLRRWRPRLVIVEIPDLHPDFQGAASEPLRDGFRAVRRSFADAGYGILFRDSVNTVYLAPG
jgi:FkbM family methyltransferase